MQRWIIFTGNLPFPAAPAAQTSRPKSQFSAILTLLRSNRLKGLVHNPLLFPQRKNGPISLDLVPDEPVSLILRTGQRS
jgi:hypothetical protein